MKKFTNLYWTMIIMGIIFGVLCYYTGWVTMGVWCGIMLWVPQMLPDHEKYRQQ